MSPTITASVARAHLVLESARWEQANAARLLAKAQQPPPVQFQPRPPRPQPDTGIYQIHHRPLSPGLHTIQVRRPRAPRARPAPITLTTPADLAQLARTIYDSLDADQEHFVIIVVDRANTVLGYKLIASGGRATVDVDHGLLFRSALLLGAGAIIALHNHPSGQLQPSPEDIRLTVRLMSAGDMLGIPIHDHVIYSRGAIASIRALCPELWQPSLPA